MDQEKNQIKFVLITGASSGFGIDFARVFARHGFNVLLVGRNEKKLIHIVEEIKEQYRIDVRYVVIDLTSKEAGRKLFDWVVQQNIHISCLVNNAGMGNYGRFTDRSLGKQRELIELNVGVLTELCHLFLPGMIKAKEGKILNIASLAAFQPGPYFATYYASKAYVLHFSEALALEYKSDNITVSALCPGPSPTNFFERAGMIPSWFMKLQMMDPQKVAEEGFKGLMRNKTVIIPGIKNNFAPLGSRLFPRSVLVRLSKKLIEWAAKNKHPFIPS